MLIKDFIDLARINIFAAANDHVSFAIDNVKEAVLIAIANIAGVKPAVAKSGRVRLAILEIAFEYVLAPQDDFAKLTIRNFIVLVVNNPHFISDWQAARAGATALVRGIESRAASRFRKTVAFDDRAIESVLKLLHYLSRDRG